VFDDEQVQIGKKEDVLNALGQSASKFRKKAGESLATIKEHETPLVEATTPSFEAWKLYSDAWKLVLSQDTTGAVPLLQRAIEIDPKFAMAYALLGRIYGDSWQTALAAENIRKAFELRERATDPERFFITFSYQTQVTGNLEEAQRTGESWVQTYPRVLQAPTLLSAAYQNLGKYERSAEFAKRAIELNPNFPFGPTNLAWAYLFLERYADAESTVRQAAEHKLAAPDLSILPYVLAFYKGDQTEMERAAAAAKENTDAADWMTNIEGSVAAHSGHLHGARIKTLQAMNLARQTHQEERAALFETGAAVREALLGNTREGREGAQRALELSKSRDVEYGSAFALAISGDDSAALAFAKDLEMRFPEDTLVRFTYLPVIRALSALNHGRPSDVIEQLQISAPYDLAIPGTWFGFYGNLYPIYVRGQAYLAENRNAEAAGEFQKILDHPGIVCSDPVGVVARLQLGRAYALSGDKAKAKSAYEDFLTLWKNGDTDIPILRQAQAEYAKLR
jgi:tetratricopeptide (TPR) repeat protein